MKRQIWPSDPSAGIASYRFPEPHFLDRNARMLTAFTLEDFKSYRQATRPLSALTLLVGATASGKSNAVEGRRLLSWLERGQRLSSILHATQCDEQFNQAAIFTQRTSPASFEASHEISLKQISPIVTALEKQLSSILFLAPRPTYMRGYTSPSDGVPRDDGSNRQSVCHRRDQWRVPPPEIYAVYWNRTGAAGQTM